MRLFVAIDLPENVRNQLVILRADIPGAKWIEPDNYHLTLQFLGGNIPPDKLPEIVETLKTIRAVPFEMGLKGVERFGSRRNPGVVVAKVVKTAELVRLYEAVTMAMDGIGFEPDKRPFNPHITLAYLKQFKVDEAVRGFQEKYTDFETDSFPVNAFVLYESKLTQKGAAYQARETFSLGD